MAGRRHCLVKSTSPRSGVVSPSRARSRASPGQLLRGCPPQGPVPSSTLARTSPPGSSRERSATPCLNRRPDPGRSTGDLGQVCRVAVGAPHCVALRSTAEVHHGPPPHQVSSRLPGVPSLRSPRLRRRCRGRSRGAGSPCRTRCRPGAHRPTGIRARDVSGGAQGLRRRALRAVQDLAFGRSSLAVHETRLRRGGHLLLIPSREWAHCQQRWWRSPAGGGPTGWCGSRGAASSTSRRATARSLPGPSLHVRHAPISGRRPAGRPGPGDQHASAVRAPTGPWTYRPLAVTGR